MKDILKSLITVWIILLGGVLLALGFIMDAGTQFSGNGTAEQAQTIAQLNEMGAILVFVGIFANIIFMALKR